MTVHALISPRVFFPPVLLLVLLSLRLASSTFAQTFTFSLTGSLADARVYHTATLLPNGEVLIVGGEGTTGAELRSVEIYNPVTGTTRDTGQLIQGRRAHTATLLKNGKVLVVGDTSAPRTTF